MNKSFSIMWNKVKLALRSWEVQYAFYSNYGHLNTSFRQFYSSHSQKDRLSMHACAQFPHYDNTERNPTKIYSFFGDGSLATIL